MLAVTWTRKNCSYALKHSSDRDEDGFMTVSHQYGSRELLGPNFGRAFRHQRACRS